MVTTLVPTLDKGTFENHTLLMNSFENFEFGGGNSGSDNLGHQYNHRVPKLDFPRFDGTDPQDR